MRDFVKYILFGVMYVVLSVITLIITGFLLGIGLKLAGVCGCG